MDLSELTGAARRAYAEGRIDEAIELQSRAVRIGDRSDQFSLQDHLRLTVYLTAAGQIGRARSFLDDIRHRADGQFDYHLNLGRLHLKRGEDEEALKELLTARRIDNDQPSVNDSLAMVLGRMGRLEESVKCGEIALLLRSKTAAQMPALFEIPEEEPAPINLANPAENVIVFSLVEPSEEVVRGAIRNATFAHAVYPGWRCRFYVGSNFPVAGQRDILRAGGQIVQVAGHGRLKDPRLWKLHVLGDRKVKYFLMRDPLALVNVRERVAVDNWLESGRHFHVMRDHYSHTELILPGLWGGVNGVIPPVLDLLKGFAPDLLSSGSLVSALLADRVWPSIRKSVCIHDRHHSVLRARKFPSLGGLPENEYVGQPMPLDVPILFQSRRPPSARTRASDLEEVEEELHALTYSRDDIVL